MFAAAVLILLATGCRSGAGGSGIGEFAAVEETPRAVISGHIRSRETYPNTQRVDMKVPFYGRVPRTVSSWITPEDSVFFEFEPYGTRVVAIEPYISNLIVHPGDSLDIGLDFSDFNNVTFSGRGAEDNTGLFLFNRRYYGGHWSSYSRIPSAEEYAAALKADLSGHLGRLDEFAREQNPSKELARVCRRIIDTDYLSALLQGLLVYAEREDVSGFFDVREVEKLFSDDLILKKQYDLSALAANMLFVLTPELPRTIAFDDFGGMLRFLRGSTSNRLLRQMMLTYAYDYLLDSNDTDKFEEYFDSFNRDVTFPLLRLSVRDKYIEKKGYSLNPRAISDAILNADVPKDGTAVGNGNPGLGLLRDIVRESAGQAVHLSIGALWCPGCRQEIPYQNKLIDDYAGRPLRVVSFYMESQEAYDKELKTLDEFPRAEHFLLDNSQREGIDQILHMGRGIPFYILIDRNGVIVDYGEHLSPSLDGTRKRIDKLL